MPPLRTQGTGPQRLILRKGSQDRFSPLSSSFNLGNIHSSQKPRQEVDYHSRDSSASLASVTVSLGVAGPSNITPETKKTNVFFQDLSDSELHREFLPKYMKTNICDQCNKRNKSVMQRCIRCNMHFCKSCTGTVDDGKHRFDAAPLDWSPPEEIQRIRVPKAPTYRRRGKNVTRNLVPGSGSRVEKHRGTRLASPAPAPSNRRRIRFIDRPAEEIPGQIVMPVNNEPQGDSFFIQITTPERVDNDEIECRDGSESFFSKALAPSERKAGDRDIYNTASTHTEYPSPSVSMSKAASPGRLNGGIQPHTDQNRRPGPLSYNLDATNRLGGKLPPRTIRAEDLAPSPSGTVLNTPGEQLRAENTASTVWRRPLSPLYHPPSQIRAIVAEQSESPTRLSPIAEKEVTLPPHDLIPENHLRSQRALAEISAASSSYDSMDYHPTEEQSLLENSISAGWAVPFTPLMNLSSLIGGFKDIRPVEKVSVMLNPLYQIQDERDGPIASESSCWLREIRGDSTERFWNRDSGRDSATEEAARTLLALRGDESSQLDIRLGI